MPGTPDKRKQPPLTLLDRARRRGRPLVDALLATAIPGWRQLARRWWCAEQRTRLRALDPRVVWVHDGEKMPWALWGAENGFFEVEWANRLPYLRAIATVG